jgi:hypothetical protein
MNSLLILYFLFYFCILILYSLTIAVDTTTLLPYYELSSITFMPVTTRSRAKLLKAIIAKEVLKPISSNSSILSTSTTTTSITTPFALQTTPNEHLQLVGSSRTPPPNKQHDDTLVLSSSSFESHNFEISKFQTPPAPSHITSTVVPCHNFLISKNTTMEADCKDSTSLTFTSSSNKDPMDMIQQLFLALSPQIDHQNKNMLHDFHQVVQDNKNFKQEVREELDKIRQILHQQKVSSTSLTSSPLPVPPVNGNSRWPTNNHWESSFPQGLSSGVSSTPDMQTQMMYMLTESFSKLSSALSEKSHDTKSDWPKFNGDIKKFRPWYLAIIA